VRWAERSFSLSIVYSITGGNQAPGWALVANHLPIAFQRRLCAFIFCLLDLSLRTTFHARAQSTKRLTMTRYKALNGNSGLTAYAVSPDSIIVEFKDRRVYLYNYCIPGAKEVEAMKLLAAKGRGLTTFINKRVRNRYAARLR
jgi:hypothetical protein